MIKLEVTLHSERNSLLYNVGQVPPGDDLMLDHRMTFEVIEGNLDPCRLYLRTNAQVPVQYWWRYLTLNLFMVNIVDGLIYRPIGLFRLREDDPVKYFLLDTGAIQSWDYEVQPGLYELHTMFELQPIPNAYLQLLPMAKYIGSLPKFTPVANQVLNDIAELKENPIRNVLSGILNYAKGDVQKGISELTNNADLDKNSDVKDYLNKAVELLSGRPQMLMSAEIQDVLLIASADDALPDHDSNLNDYMEAVEAETSGKLVVVKRNTDEVDKFEDIKALIQEQTYQHIVFLGHGHPDGGMYLEFEPTGQNAYLFFDFLPLLSDQLNEDDNNALIFLGCDTHHYTSEASISSVSPNLNKKFNVVFSPGSFTIVREGKFIKGFYQNYRFSGNFHEAYEAGRMAAGLFVGEYYDLSTMILGP